MTYKLHVLTRVYSLNSVIISTTELVHCEHSLQQQPFQLAFLHGDIIPVRHSHSLAFADALDFRPARDAQVDRSVAPVGHVDGVVDEQLRLGDLDDLHERDDVAAAVGRDPRPVDEPRAPGLADAVAVRQPQRALQLALGRAERLRARHERVHLERAALVLVERLRELYHGRERGEVLVDASVAVVVDAVLQLLVDPAVAVVVHAVGRRVHAGALAGDVREAKSARVAVRVAPRVAVHERAEGDDRRGVVDPVRALRHVYRRCRVRRALDALERVARVGRLPVHLHAADVRAQDDDVDVALEVLLPGAVRRREDVVRAVLFDRRDHDHERVRVGVVHVRALAVLHQQARLVRRDELVVVRVDVPLHELSSVDLEAHRRVEHDGGVVLRGHHSEVVAFLSAVQRRGHEAPSPRARRREHLDQVVAVALALRHVRALVAAVHGDHLGRRDPGAGQVGLVRELEGLQAIQFDDQRVSVAVHGAPVLERDVAFHLQREVDDGRVFDANDADQRVLAHGVGHREVLRSLDVRRQRQVRVRAVRHNVEPVDDHLVVSGHQYALVFLLRSGHARAEREIHSDELVFLEVQR